MPNVSGFVYYNPLRLIVPGTGIANVPVALYSAGGVGAIALTNALGAYSFTNVPAGSYKIIETWGTPGGIASPVDFLANGVVMAQPPEVEPPLSAIAPIIPPPLADALDALSPNLLSVTVGLVDLLLQNFFDGPVGNKPIVFNDATICSGNLITAADNGTWGTFPGGTAPMTTNPVAPYPGVTPGFTYSVSTTPNDGFYTVMNTRAFEPIWWNVSDHTSKVETGRFILVNGAGPGAVIFTQPVAVTPNTNYSLAAWILNLIKLPLFAMPKLAFQVLDSMGNQLAYQDVNAIAETPIPVWYQNGLVFNTAGNNNITVEIISTGAAATGNDFLIDDITLTELCYVNQLEVKKQATPAVIFAGTDVTFTSTVTNTSASLATNIGFQDILDPTLVFVPGSVTINAVPFPAYDPNVGFPLTDLAPGASHVIVFHAIAAAGPSPVKNVSRATYAIGIDANGNILYATVFSNTVLLSRLLNDFVQPSNDLATSVALEQTALSHILNAEGEKIQAALAIPGVTPAQLLCINASVQGMIGAISNLEMILASKLEIVQCQLVGFPNSDCNCDC